MNTETYINHPNFGLLYRICLVGDNQELFTTLYAQRLYFLVSNHPEGLQFQPVTRNEARIIVENRLRMLRRNGQIADYKELMKMHQQHF
jgi:PII interaction protein X